MVFSTSVDAHWLKKSTRFWYSYETPSGKSYYIVDPAKKSKSLLFDNVDMAAQLSRLTKDRSMRSIYLYKKSSSLKTRLSFSLR
jgi:hypothetical protein